MKTFLILVTVLFTVDLVANELSWVDEQVEAIKPPRTGMKSRELSTTKDPFIFLSKNRIKHTENKDGTVRRQTTSTSSKTTTVSALKKPKKKQGPLSVAMVMNSSAMINGHWYKVGDKIKGYRVSNIDSTSVLLTKNEKKLLLSTKSKSKNLNFRNK